MILLDLLFSSAAWYRRWRAGPWYRVRCEAVGEIFWTRRPFACDAVLDAVHYDPA